MPNKSLDASGGSVFLNLLGAAEGALNRAATSTQPLGGFALADKFAASFRRKYYVTYAESIFYFSEGYC